MAAGKDADAPEGRVERRRERLADWMQADKSALDEIRDDFDAAVAALRRDEVDGLDPLAATVLRQHQARRRPPLNRPNEEADMTKKDERTGMTVFRADRKKASAVRQSRTQAALARLADTASRPVAEGVSKEREICKAIRELVRIGHFQDELALPTFKAMAGLVATASNADALERLRGRKDLSALFKDPDNPELETQPEDMVIPPAPPLAAAAKVARDVDESALASLWKNRAGGIVSLIGDDGNPELVALRLKNGGGGRTQTGIAPPTYEPVAFGEMLAEWAAQFGDDQSLPPPGRALAELSMLAADRSRPVAALVAAVEALRARDEERRQRPPEELLLDSAEAAPFPPAPIREQVDLPPPQRSNPAMPTKTLELSQFVGDNGNPEAEVPLSLPETGVLSTLQWLRYVWSTIDAEAKKFGGSEYAPTASQAEHLVIGMLSHMAMKDRNNGYHGKSFSIDEFMYEWLLYQENPNNTLKNFNALRAALMHLKYGFAAYLPVKGVGKVPLLQTTIPETPDDKVVRAMMWMDRGPISRWPGGGRIRWADACKYRHQSKMHCRAYYVASAIMGLTAERGNPIARHVWEGTGKAAKLIDNPAELKDGAPKTNLVKSYSDMELAEFMAVRLSSNKKSAHVQLGRVRAAFEDLAFDGVIDLVEEPKRRRKDRPTFRLYGAPGEPPKAPNAKR